MNVEAAQLADVWRKPEDPRWCDAYVQVRDALRSVMGRHAMYRDHFKDPDRLEEVLADLWIYLVENPAKLEASRHCGIGAVKTEIYRYLCKRLGYEGSEPRLQLRAHLNDKVKASLRGGEQFEKDGRAWRLSGQQLSTDTFPADEDVADALPVLEARLKPQRRGQLPPLVSKEALPPFLGEALKLSRRPRTPWALTDFTWGKLEPSPDGQMALKVDSERALGSHGMDGAAADRADPEREAVLMQWAVRVDMVASQFVDGLKPDVARAAALYHCHELDVRQVGETMGIGKSTAANKIQKFEQQLGARLSEEEVKGDREVTLHLVNTIRDILRVEDFNCGKEASP